MAGEDLKGFTIVVTADRRRDEQVVLMERLGADVLAYPLLRTEPEDPGALRAGTEEVVREPPDYLVANTGYGMRTWLGLAAQWGLQDDLVSSLGRKTAIAARGAKALGEIRKLGLDAWYKAPGETLEEVVARLLEEDLTGRSVVVQLHGEPPGSTVTGLERAGARVGYLPVYRMGEGGAEAVGALIETLLAGTADVVTFTAAPQVEALAAAALAQGDLGPVLDGFNTGGVIAACIGPVCAEAARGEGIDEPMVPEHARLGSLARSVGAELAGRQVVAAGRSGSLAISGRLVTGDGVTGEGGELWVGPPQQRALRVLCVRPGEWVDLKLIEKTGGGALSSLAAALDGAIEVADGSVRLLTA